MTTPNIPTFLQPNVAGELTNVLGSDQTTNKIQFILTYSNPLGATRFCGNLQIQSSRLSIEGITSDPAWNSWFSSTGNCSSLGQNQGYASPNCSAIYNGRIYVYSNNSTSSNVTLYSAPINGPNIGSWREETAIVNTINNLVLNDWEQVSSITIINGFIYAWASGVLAVGQPQAVFYAPIASGNGAVGQWTQFAMTGMPAFGNAIPLITSLTDMTGSWLIAVWADKGSAAAGSAFVAINPDGSQNGSWKASTNQPRVASDALYGCALFVLPSGKNDGVATLYTIGGSVANSTAPVLNISHVTLTSGDITTAWTSYTTNTTGLPAARSNFGFSWSGPDANNDYQLVIVGGNLTTAYIPYAGGAAQYLPTTGQTNTLWYIKASQLGTVWTVGGALATAVDGCAGAFTGNLPGAAWAAADVFSIGGNIGGGPPVSMYSAVQRSHWNGAAFPAFTLPGTGNNLVAADLGTGGVVVNNQDGTQQITFQWNAFGIASVNSLVLGDTVTFTVIFYDNRGDPSSPQTITFKCGLPPTITSISPANAATVVTAAIPVSFTHNPQTGNNPQSQFRIRIQSVGGATTYYDTGVLPGQANSATAQTFPALANGNYQLVIDSWAGDTAFPGSTAQATSTTTFTLTAT